MKHLLEEIKLIKNNIELLSAEKKAIQEKISALEDRENSIRDSIMEEMVKSKTRYESFADFAEIKIQKTARSYETIDEKKLIDFLKTMGKYDEVVKVTTKISSAPLVKFLDELRSADAIPSCVKLKESEDSLRITFVDKADENSFESKKKDSYKEIDKHASWEDPSGQEFDSL